MGEILDWAKPSPLWQADGQDARQADFFRPALLQFESDDFMDEFFAAAGARKPAALQKAVAAPPDDGRPLKLFQPIHGRFYLVCGSLCCRSPGFPDRALGREQDESVFFVLRKVVNGSEYAWTAGGAKPGWRPLNGEPRRVPEGEERMPLAAAKAGNGRSVFVGYLPVASRETLKVPPQELAVNGQVKDPRVEEFTARFALPLAPAASTPSTNVFQYVPADLEVSVSVYFLLDLWEYLDTHLADVAAALRDNPDATFTGDRAQAKAALMAALKAQALKGSLKLGPALGEAARQRPTLNQPGGVRPDQMGALGFGADYGLKGVTVSTGTLTQKVQAALPPEMPEVTLPKVDVRAGTRYLLRCVYERPHCDPPQVVSLPSPPFTLAAYFDPDAPARTIHIPLPTDVSIAALRRFKKGVTFMLSDAMRKKANSIVGKEKDLLKESQPDIEESNGEVAFVCSFSIQIIFIVAFFLLLIFVFVLNFVFWWLAFFKICLPVPKSLLPE